MPQPEGYRALVCITTCLRLSRLRRYLPPFTAFCQRDRRFHLLVSLDGTEAPYLDFCERWRVPLVYADEREGVGLSKNRVLESFPDFDYYFFLEDDVELVDGSVFPAHVDLARNSGIHHFSLFERGTVRRPVSTSTVAGHRVVHGMFGGGQFSFFTREGLDRVGGWHPSFAEYRRWGHTEHSYRFFRSGLAPAPFNVAEDLADACIWHYPAPVTARPRVPVDADQLPEPERELIDRELEHVPVQTLSSYHFNGVPFHATDELAAIVSADDRYPLVSGAERRECLSDFLLWRSRNAPGWMAKVALFLRATALWPANPMVRHTLKQRLTP